MLRSVCRQTWIVRVFDMVERHLLSYKPPVASEASESESCRLLRAWTSYQKLDGAIKNRDGCWSRVWEDKIDKSRSRFSV
jgi:hypothetical protein